MRTHTADARAPPRGRQLGQPAPRWAPADTAAHCAAAGRACSGVRWPPARLGSPDCAALTRLRQRSLRSTLVRHGDSFPRSSSSWATRIGLGPAVASQRVAHRPAPTSTRSCPVRRARHVTQHRAGRDRGGWGGGAARRPPAALARAPS
jgi:hypothetical protein